MREVWAQRPPLSFYHPFSSLLEVSNSSLMFFSSHEGSSHLAGHFWGWESEHNLGEHNPVETELWEASVSLTIQLVFAHEECRWMMEQWRGQLSRIMSCGRGCAQGGGGSSASSWKSSHLCQQGAASSAQVFWSILEKGHCDVIYRQFCAVRSPLWSRHVRKCFSTE